MTVASPTPKFSNWHVICTCACTPRSKNDRQGVQVHTYARGTAGQHCSKIMFGRGVLAHMLRAILTVSRWRCDCSMQRLFLPACDLLNFIFSKRFHTNIVLNKEGIYHVLVSLRHIFFSPRKLHRSKRIVTSVFIVAKNFAWNIGYKSVEIQRCGVFRYTFLIACTYFKS